jgi:hypothetical protein
MNLSTARTWSSLREEIRHDIDDPSGTKSTDATLMVYINDALRDLSSYFGLLTVTSVTASEEQLAFDLPTDCIEVLAVEVGGVTQKPISIEPGLRLDTFTGSFPTSGYFIADTSMGTQMRFVVAPGAHILHYRACYAVVTEDGSVIRVPWWAWEALRLYVNAKVQENVALQDANLRRWATSRDAGSPTDNPIIPAVRYLMDRYHAIMYAHENSIVQMYRS